MLEASLLVLALPSYAYRIEGMKYTDPRYVADELRLERLPDDADSAARDSFALVLQNELGNLGPFSYARVAYRHDSSLFVVRVTETLPFLPYLSVAHDDEVGWLYSAGFFGTNVDGRNRRGSLIGVIGGYKRLSAFFDSPESAGRKLGWGLALSLKDKPWPYENFVERGVDVTGEVGYWERQYFRSRALFGVTTVSVDTPGVTVNPGLTDVYLITGVRILYDDRDLPINPRRGWRIVANTALYTGLGTDASFWTGEASVTRVVGLGPLTLVGNAAVTLQSKRVPRYRTLYVGGQSTVRGWDFGADKGVDRFLARSEARTDLFDLYLPAGAFSQRLTFIGYGYLESGSVWRTSPERAFTATGVGLGVLFPLLSVLRVEYERPVGGAGGKYWLDVGWAF